MFSTGSAESWVTATVCPSTQCIQTRFDSAASSSYVYSTVSGSIPLIEGLVLGKYVTDFVCLSEESVECMSNFEFLFVESTSNLPVIQYSSVMGLRPPQLDMAIEKQFLPYLVQSGVVDLPMFVMRLRFNDSTSEEYTDDSRISEIEFGSPDDTSIFQMVYMPPNPQHWILNVVETNVFGYNSGRPDIEAVIFDSSLPYIYMPLADIEMVKEWFGVPGCVIDDNYIFSCPCTNETDIDQYFNYLIIKVGSFDKHIQLTINGNAYMYFDGDETCVSWIRQKPALENTRYWELGLPYYQSFDVFHDMTNNQMGFMPYNNSQVTEIFLSTQGAKQIASSLALVVGCLMVFVF